MKRIALTAAVLAIGILHSAGKAHAGVVAISQASALRVTGVAGPETNTFDQKRTSEGVLSDILNGEASTSDGIAVRASASQGPGFIVSTPAGIVGHVIGGANVFATYPQNGPLGLVIVTATSDFNLRFRVTGHAEPFAIQGEFTGAFTSGTISLAETSDPGLQKLIFSASNEDPFSFSFNRLGTLPIGTYTLTAGAFAGSSGGGGSETQFSTFDASFSVGHAVHPIPLPPAILPGAASLMLIAGLRACFLRSARQLRHK